MIKKVKMENLICSGCAGKIERAVNNLEYVISATYNMPTQTMLIEFKDSFNKEKAIKEIDKIVKTYEHGVLVYYLGEKKNDNSKLNTGYIMFFAGLLLYGLNEIFVRNIYLFLFGYLLVSNMIMMKSIRNIKKGSVIDENVLMLLATIAAICIGENMEAILVIVFYTIGEYFQQRAVGKARNSISSLMDLKVSSANKLKAGKFITVSPETLVVDDIILVRKGERIPVDGRVIKGEAALDTKSLTGESKLLNVSMGTEVLSGMINEDGLIQVRVTKEYKDSAVSRIIDLIENSTNQKTKTENFITKFARVYTPIVTLIAFLLFVIPVYCFQQDFNEYMYRACVFLVISCPCALVLSIPMAYFAGIGKSAKYGVLFKGSNYLDNLPNVKDIFLDKTGTITKGELRVVKFTSEDVIKYAASIERYSNHPIAKAILSAKNEFFEVSDLKEYAGKGLIGNINGLRTIVGNRSFLEDNNIIIDNIDSINTLVFVAHDDKYLGVIELADEVKQSSIHAINEFKKQGINVHMLTGDNDLVAKEVANALNIDYKASLLPQGKVDILSNYKSTGLKLFIGDGINDGPVLAASDIAVSMGQVGSDVAIEVSDVVILDDDINKINETLKVARKTRRIVKQNIILTLGVKLLFLGLGALGVSTILLALIADVGIALIAVFNSFRIIRG